jgi:hypothetical protein
MWIRRRLSSPLAAAERSGVAAPSSGGPNRKRVAKRQDRKGGELVCE